MSELNEDVGKIATALGLFASCIKSGEEWTPVCERALREAQAALTKLAEQAKQNEGAHHDT
jgi:hypothetical protein